MTKRLLLGGTVTVLIVAVAIFIAFRESPLVASRKPAENPVVVFGDEPSVKGPRPLSSAKFNYPQAAVYSPAGDLYVANSLGGSVERISGDKIQTVLGQLGNPGGRINRYNDVELENDTNLLVADGDGSAIYRIDLGSWQHSLFSKAPAVGMRDGDYFFISGISARDGQVLAYGSPVRPITPASSRPAGPNSLYIIENDNWRLVASDVEVNGAPVKFRDVEFKEEGGFVAIAGTYFVSLDRDGAVEKWVEIGSHYGGGILHTEDGWLVGAHTRLLRIDENLTTAVPVPLQRRIANFGHLSAGGDDGEVLVTDTDSQSVFIVNVDTGEVLQQIGNAGVATKIVALEAMTDGTVLMLENATPRLFSYDPASGSAKVIAGTGVQAYASRPAPAEEFSLQFPNSVAVGPDGAIYVTESNYRIVRIADGEATVFAGDIHRGNAESGQHRTRARFHRLRGIDVDALGRVWVVEEGRSNLWRIELDGTITQIMGIGRDGEWVEGEPANTQPLRSPYDVIARVDGSVLVSDTYNSMIVEITPEGFVKKFAGTPKPLSYQGQGSFGGDGGSALEAEFNTPRALAEGADGSVYVMDSFNNRVRRISPDGIIDTVAGGGFGISDDASKLNHPTGLTVTETHLYLADTGNSVVWAVPLD